MLLSLKIVHFIAMSVGIGLGVGNMVLGIRAKVETGPAMVALRKSQATFGRIALIAIVFLWLSGLWLWLGFHTGAMTPLFAVKLAAVVALTALSLLANVKAARAARGGAPVNPALVRKIGMGMGLMSLIAVICAVLVFN